MGAGTAAPDGSGLLQSAEPFYHSLLERHCCALCCQWLCRPAAVVQAAARAPLYAAQALHLSPSAPPAAALCPSLPQVPARYGDRNGGYCRVKADIQPRRGDNTEMATIELV